MIEPESSPATTFGNYYILLSVLNSGVLFKALLLQKMPKQSKGSKKKSKKGSATLEQNQTHMVNVDQEEQENPWRGFGKFGIVRDI